MSYCRTSIALIGFGFTLYQFLAKLGPSKMLARGAPDASQELSLLLIGVGLTFLAIGTWDYYAVLRYMHVETFAPIAGVGTKRWKSGALIATSALFLAGTLAFLAVLVRL